MTIYNPFNFENLTREELINIIKSCCMVDYRDRMNAALKQLLKTDFKEVNMDLTYYIKELNKTKCIVVSYKVKTDLVKYLEDSLIKYHCMMDDYFQYHIHLM